NMERLRAQRGGFVAIGGGAGPDIAGGGGGGRQVITMRVGGDGAEPPRRGGDRAQGNASGNNGSSGANGSNGNARGNNGNGNAQPELPPLNFVSPSELPDYKPVFSTGSVRADMDDRIWVRTIPTKASTAGAIYDVIDRSGKLVDRVQVPVNATIAGFGKGGVVYVGTREGGEIRLQRVRVGQ
ncbi:MAG TPA: hypothetical protein VFP15_00955, partial [Gemmatimonadaceae bacterium]|nr:hypothetical protein [Gemmatimonadaceae bacterium]